MKIKKKLAPVGIEPKTFALLARRSNQLSYGASWLMLLQYTIGFRNINFSLIFF